MNKSTLSRCKTSLVALLGRDFLNRKVPAGKLLRDSALIVCSLLALTDCLTAQPIRQTLNFNRDWRFELGDHTEAKKSAFNDARWNRVGLPHSFSLPYFGSSRFYTGYGWYRKRFQVPANWKGQRVALDFEGVFQDAEVFVNGQKVGQHRGGYTGFELDISKAIQRGDNCVAVRVNNLWDARLAPRAGEHAFSGGIYRDVSLVVKSPVHVAWYGTAITTPQVSKEAATVNVKTEVVNDSSTSQDWTVRHSLFSPEGKLVSQWQWKRNVAAGKSLIFNQTSKSIPNPKLWHPDHPFLYNLKTQVLKGSTVVDSTESTVGFRWFKWTKDQGFFLNGEHFYIYGANVHQDHAGWGDAVTNAGFERDVKMVKDAGFNFIRGSHYPHDPAFARACDKLGILFWSENAFWGIGGFRSDGYWNSSAYPPEAKDRPEFEASVKRQLSEMIRIGRNHPSIVAWSMCNEVFFSENSTLPRVKSFLGELVDLTHQLDPTRPAAIGGTQRPLDENRIDLVGDVTGYNGDGAVIPLFQNPGVPNIVSEYGNRTTIRPGDYSPGWDSLERDNGKPVHPWRSGQVIWCMFDHGSIAGENMARLGIVDYFRIPKRTWYWYRNEYKHIPPPIWPTAGVPAKLRLQADKTVIKSADGTDDVHLLVSVLDAANKELSNSLPVTLELVSGPGEFPTGRSITFEPKSDIAMLDGKAAIEFRSYYAGTSVIRASSPGLPSSEITIVSQGAPVWSAGKKQESTSRPYIRYMQQPNLSSIEDTGTRMTLAADRPTKASSVALGSSSANVNDGRINTFWEAANSVTSPWIRVDLESTYTVNRVRLTFPGEGNYRYRIQVTSNGKDWATVVDQSQTSNTDSVRTSTGNFGQGVRYLRVLFDGWPVGKNASLAEITVGGGNDIQFNAKQLGGTIIGTAGSWEDNPQVRKEAAMDGRLQSFFDAPTADGDWVGLDLGTGKSSVLSKIRFAPRPESDGSSQFAQRMVGGRFQIANQPDWSDATTVSTITALPSSGKFTELTVLNSPSGRYLRYIAPDGGNGNVSEIEFYGH